jgi:hypothetical protein
VPEGDYPARAERKTCCTAADATLTNAQASKRIDELRERPPRLASRDYLYCITAMTKAKKTNPRKARPKKRRIIQEDPAVAITTSVRQVRAKATAVAKLRKQFAKVHDEAWSPWRITTLKP